MMQRETKIMGVQPAGRPATQFQVNHEGRKPLFSKDQDASRLSFGGDIGDRSAIGAAATSATAKDASRRKSTNDFGFRAGREGNPAVVVSPGGSRIPQPSSSGGVNGGGFAKRRPISLAEAFKLAQGEEDFGDDSDGGLDHQGPVDGSPSPAPRPWRMRTSSDVTKLRKFLNKDHLDSKGQNKSQPAIDLSSSGTLVTGNKEIPVLSLSSIRSPSGATARTKTTDFNQSRSTDLRPTAMSSPRITQQLSSRGSLPGSSVGLPELVPGIDDAPSLSVEQRPTRIPSPIYQPTPEKSFTWQVEEDFAAGEIQISESPRLRVGRHLFENRLSCDDNGKVSLTSGSKPVNGTSQNTKLDDIRSREMRTGSNLPLDRPTPRTYTSKLEQIRSRESQVEQQIPIPNRHLDRLRNTKLDEIRQREESGLSRRALAAARLQEIKEMNQMTRFKEPEEVARPPSARGLYERYNKDPVPETNGFSTARPKTTGGGGEDAGRVIPDTPVIIFKRDPKHSIGNGVVGGVNGKEHAPPVVPKEAEKSEPPTSDGIIKTVDDLEWVRRLARATSTSPAVAEEKPQTQVETLPLPLPLPLSLPAGNNSRHADEAYATKSKQHEGTDAKETEPAALGLNRVLDSREIPSKPPVIQEPVKQRPKPATVVIEQSPAPSHRARLSASSVKSKRSSMQSETDPTDRIEAEMKLFAPADNQSERGSLRAPSPAPIADDDEEEEGGDNTMRDDATPRAIKPDPLSMPTPRVTGAYVDTPIISKMENKIKEEPVQAPSRARARTEPTARPSTGIIRERRASLAWRKKDQDTLSEPGTTEDSDFGATTASSAAVKRPRAKSLPRRRPPVKNSAKPPTVRDDLLLLQRAYNVEDSTFDDLDEILSGRKPLILRSDGLSDQDPLLRSSEDDSEFDSDFKVIPAAAAASTAATTTTTTTASKSPRKERKTHPEASNKELAALDRMNKSLRTGILGIRTAKQGIERLEGQIAQVNMPALDSKAMEAAATSEVKQAGVKQEENQTRQHTEKDRSGCTASSPKSTYLADIHLAIPRLFYRKPHFRLTLLGLLVFALSIWYTAESAMCSMYCRPATCSASRAPCSWSYDDPWTFGTALPIKLDQWATGGHGRVVFNHFVEEAYDWVADMQDLALGREITEINIEKLSFEDKRRHRRRLRKKGLAKPAPQPNADTRAKWDAWHQTRIAKEREREANQMG